MFSDLNFFLQLFIIITSLLSLLLIGLPIGFCMGTVGFVGLYLIADFQFALNSFSIFLTSTPMNFTLIAIPLFTLMAQIIIFCEFGKALYTSLERFLYGIPASLGLATITSGSVFAASTGSSVASCATIGPIAIKEMVQRGYKKSFAAGCVAGAGGLAIVIPPSVPFIIYGFIAEVSVSKLFIAGIVPGLLMALAMSIYVLYYGINNFDNYYNKIPLIERISYLKNVWPIMFLIILVLGSIYGGITTPTEAAAVGVLRSLFLSIIYKRLNLSILKKILIKTSTTTCFIFIIIIGALTFGFLMSYLRIPVHLAEFFLNNKMSSWEILIIINIIFFFLGMFMESSAKLLVVIPLLMPTIHTIGFDPLWIGVILLINIELGLLTPPVGMNLYIIKGIGKEYNLKFNEIVRGTIPFIFAQILVWIILILFPDLVLFLPNLM